jgi:tryptophan synthase alpha chain
MTDRLFADAGRHGRTGLVLFLNAGDPSFAELERLLLVLDRRRVDCVELAVPFLNTVTDGPVLQRSAERALEGGGDLDSTLSLVASIRHRLSHLRVVLMADWRHTVRALSLERFLARVRSSGCDGLLLHGLPPRIRRSYYASAGRAGLPIVTTCYVQSSATVLKEAARHASAYVYLVSHYGRGEDAAALCANQLRIAVDALRAAGEAPIAVGFGVRDGADIRQLREAGADAAIIGSACVAQVEKALTDGRDPVAAVERFIDRLQTRPSEI